MAHMKWRPVSEQPDSGESIWVVVLEHDGVSMHVEYAETYEEVDGLRVRRYEDERGENYWAWCPPMILAWMPCDIPAIDLPAIENLTRQKQMADDPVRLADADYVLRWVHQQGADKVPPKIHDLAARALGWPSLAHGFADDRE